MSDEIKGPFDFVDAVSSSKKRLIVDDATEKQYNPFIVNRALSYHRDAVFYANEMNRYSGLPNLLQFDFLLSTLRQAKRYSKWYKPTQDLDVQAVQAYLGLNRKKAEEAVRALTRDQLEEIKRKVAKDE